MDIDWNSKFFTYTVHCTDKNVKKCKLKVQTEEHWTDQMDKQEKAYTSEKRGKATQHPGFQQPSILLWNNDLDSRDLYSIPKQSNVYQHR